MSINPNQLHNCRTSIHANAVLPDVEAASWLEVSNGQAGTDPNGCRNVERFLSELRVLGLSQVAAICCWSIIPIAPLFSHLGVVIFGREPEEQPEWWRILSSPALLARLTDRLYED
jgi:hypothetical protein